MARELDDAILMLRTNQIDIGTWLLKTRGDPDAVLAVDATLDEHRAHWFVRETIGMLRRTFARLDVSSRTMFALIERGSCFAGTLFELALAADRSYMAAEGTESHCRRLTSARIRASINWHASMRVFTVRQTRLRMLVRRLEKNCVQVMRSNSAS